jgi:hypothetical protein
MKRHRSTPRTFRLYERLADGPRGYVASLGCPACGGIDDDHAPGCRQASRAQFGAHHVGKVNASLPGDYAALSDEPGAAGPSRARSTHTSRSSTVQRDPAPVGRSPR